MTSLGALQVKNTPAPQIAASTAPPAHSSINFADVLHQNMGSVLFSKHAAERMSDRRITLDDGQMHRVQDGIGLATQKGIRDSLVLVDDVALVVNIKSRTVITALNTAENVFTNIDGAVIV